VGLTFGLRPRLQLDVPGTAGELGQRIREASTAYTTTVVGNYLVIKIPEQRQHYWSPQLQVEMEERDGTVHVNGLFTPMPAVWTLFAGAYAFILVLGFFGTIYGLAQLQLKHPPYGLWSFPITLALIAAVYGAALFGQRVGHEQTEELAAFLHHCLKGPAS
jgi:uncharacterized integral membrane protein